MSNTVRIAGDDGTYEATLNVIAELERSVEVQNKEWRKIIDKLRRAVQDMVAATGKSDAMLGTKDDKESDEYKAVHSIVRKQWASTSDIRKVTGYSGFVVNNILEQMIDRAILKVRSVHRVSQFRLLDHLDDV